MRNIENIELNFSFKNYNAVFDFFTQFNDFKQMQIKTIDEEIKNYEIINKKYEKALKELKQAKSKFSNIFNFDFETWTKLKYENPEIKNIISENIDNYEE